MWWRQSSHSASTSQTMIIPQVIFNRRLVVLPLLCLPHFCSLLLFNHTGSSGLLLLLGFNELCSQWKFSFPGFRSGAEQGGLGTGEMRKMRLGWMTSLCSVTVAAKRVPVIFTKAFFCCRRTCVTGSLCGTDGPTLDILGRLDSVVMVNVEFTLHNRCSVSQRSGLTFSTHDAGKTCFFSNNLFSSIVAFSLQPHSETSTSLAV